MSIETNFNVAFVAAMALREKQIQQNYRPIISVHKWFARRPGTLFRALMLAEFGKERLEDLYYRSNDLERLLIVDPFVGGGTPLIEANRLGCDVIGFDINPMSTWIVREEIEHINLEAYRAEWERLRAKLEQEIADLYTTDCPLYGDSKVPVKYFLWVKTRRCDNCDENFDLFPGYLIAEDARHPKNVLICSICGELNEVSEPRSPGACWSCAGRLVLEGPAKRGRCRCPTCGHSNHYPDAAAGQPVHRLFAIEYFNPKRKSRHLGRFFKKPNAADMSKVQTARARFTALTPEFVPTDIIPKGDETNRLHRWGYVRYCDLFNDRQLLALEVSCRYIAGVADRRVRNALATNLSDLLRYQNMLCRYDSMALKSLDVFSVHGFPVSLIQCESNFLGITTHSGIGVGSGGWSNIVEKYSKAKRYCDEPFEVQHVGGRKMIIPITGESIGEKSKTGAHRAIKIECLNSADAKLPAESVDAVFTDPPYFGNVQYGELMDFCYTWLRRIVAADTNGFSELSGRSEYELTGNATMDRGMPHFADGLAAIYSVAAQALKPNAPLAFTFHHNDIDAYKAVAVAVLDAGLTCTASPPCPAEMSGSIHINGTGSSITDTIFVCRKQPREDKRSVQAAVESDISALAQSGMRVHLGDVRCVAMGHSTRLAITSLYSSWDRRLSTTDKLAIVGQSMGDVEVLIAIATTGLSTEKRCATAYEHKPHRTSATRSLF